MKKIKIKYLRNSRSFRIECIAVGDWIDLRAAEDVKMQAGEYKMIPLGVAMELPLGYEALVAPRSRSLCLTTASGARLSWTPAAR